MSLMVYIYIFFWLCVMFLIVNMVLMVFLCSLHFSSLMMPCIFFQFTSLYMDIS